MSLIYNFASYTYYNNPLTPLHKLFLGGGIQLKQKNSKIYK